jgi:hypothetical protein
MSGIPEDKRMWFYQDNQVTRGPISLQELSQLFRDDKITPATPVFREGMEDWVPLKDCRIQKTPSRRTANILFRRFAWWKVLLAFSILTILVSAVAGLFTKTDSVRIFNNLQKDSDEFDKLRDMIRK